jgi:hypothetical protein
MRAMRILTALWLVASLVAGGGAGAETPGFARSRVEVVTAAGARTAFAVELAATPEQLERGLMFRSRLDSGEGMLFDFGAARPVAMWMKNTLIPLDMLFIDRGGRVIHVEEYAVPGSLQPRGPSAPVLAVLELAGGTARRLKLGVGDRVEHPLFARGAVTPPPGD